jgi:hypothetical protein
MWNAVAMILAAALMAGGSAFAGESVLGAVLPDTAQKVAELRYRIRGSMEDAMKFYKNVYPPQTYPRKNIANQPGVKAIHLANPNGKGWEGLNIYEANDEVRIYVVPVGESGKKKPKKK